jgi:hypothetical protein
MLQLTNFKPSNDSIVRGDRLTTVRAFDEKKPLDLNERTNTMTYHIINILYPAPALPRLVATVYSSFYPTLC